MPELAAVPLAEQSEVGWLEAAEPLAALALPEEVRPVDRDGGVVARLPSPNEHQAGCAEFTAAGNQWVRFPGRPELLEITAGLEVVHRHQASDMGRRAGACSPPTGGGSGSSPHPPGRAVGCWGWSAWPTSGVVDRRALPDAYAQVVRFYRHPDGHSVGLAVSAGADTHTEYWARPEEEPIVLWSTPGPGQLTAIHPAGQEYLTMHDWDKPPELTRRRWPDGLVLARLPLATVAPSAAFLGAGHDLTGELVMITVGTAEQRSAHRVLSRAPLHPLGWVRYPGLSTLPGDLGPCRDGAWLTMDHGQTPTTVRRLTLARPPRPTTHLGVGGAAT